MAAFTERQRVALVERCARAIVWQHSQQYEKDNARNLARSIVKELDDSPASDRAVRRGIQTVVERLEETA